MAKLTNTSNDVIFELFLQKKPNDKSWLTYKIIILIKNYQEEIFKEYLKMENDNMLFLCVDEEINPENEVHTLYKGIKSLVRDKLNSFFFQPIDEKDFKLKIKRKNDPIRKKEWINLSFSCGTAYLFTHNLWQNNADTGIIMQVSEQSLLKFSDELWQEYQSILS